MAKDPAFLFYYQDFLVGTDDLTNEEVGAYIRCLCFQAAKGGISENHMKKICESSEVHNKIKNKFIFNSLEKKYVNVRLQDEVDKRRKYCESRSINKKGKNHMKNISKSYDQHMENENENENEDINTDKKESGKTSIIVKKNDMSKKSDTRDIPLPFSEIEFIQIWAEWLKYRSERRLGAYTPTGLKRTLNRLVRDCGGDCATAIEMIDYAISKSWIGIFPINNKINGTITQRAAEKPTPTGNVAPGGFGQF